MLSHSLSDAVSKLVRADGQAVEWAVSTGYVDYAAAVEAMEARAAAIAAGEAGELVWLLEHPPLYTAGVTAKEADLLDAARFPVHQTGRGGQFTYHGPGQRVAYVMLDLGVTASMDEADAALKASFVRVFGAVGNSPPDEI